MSLGHEPVQSNKSQESQRLESDYLLSDLETTTGPPLINGNDRNRCNILKWSQDNLFTRYKM
jgi:hypothetical protein